MTSLVYRNFPSLIRSNIWDDFFNGVSDKDLWSDSGFPVYEQFLDSNDDLILEFALAGYSPEQLSIQAEGKNLMVSAEKAEDNDERPGQRIARRSFTKRFVNNGDLDFNNLKATFENGILKIEIPRNEESRLKVFNILQK